MSDTSSLDDAALFELIAHELTRMRSLEANLAATNARIASYRCSLNLPKRIPPEIIQVIFRHCVSFDLRGCDETSSTHNPRRAPLVLTQICSSWRRISLDTPSLWTHYVVSFGPEPNYTFIQNVPQMTKFCVARWKGRLGTMAF
ncbi:hypothetical protein BDN70DRAFT_886639 [Pholiota conissans]|uniref:F-box domain-containing protein n=1 Tax=Pholiota conissans TaxID=109636 RepID=A0A9P5YNU3_9AGAR|nr:hypothetical protein BDN70DRAFT_886639 [Pholiota conissans]